MEEAIEEIKKLKQELDTRDNQIEQLIDSSNQLHQEADLLEQDNLAMKEKLGLSVDDVVRPKGMMARHKEAQTKITTLQKELDECKEIIVNLKLKVYNLFFIKINIILDIEFKTLCFRIVVWVNLSTPLNIFIQRGKAI